MGWHGQLDLRFRRDGERTLSHDRHEGPLRVLASLYPEGPGVCHQVLVHPPGGMVGGDTLGIDAAVGADCHALITTPGATRFYRSAAVAASQSLNARLAAGARLEWLPLETIVHPGARGAGSLHFEMGAGSEMIGWDVLALGLPGAAQPFEGTAGGRYMQQIEVPGIWLERGRVDAADVQLLDSPLGWAGRRVLGTLWFAGGSPLAQERRDALLDAARSLAGMHPLASSAGATSPHDQVVVLRALAPRVEPAMALLVSVWARWRELAWGMAACLPRVWKT